MWRIFVTNLNEDYIIIILDLIYVVNLYASVVRDNVVCGRGSVAYGIGYKKEFYVCFFICNCVLNMAILCVLYNMLYILLAMFWRVDEFC